MNVEINIDKTGTLTFEMNKEQLTAMIAAAFGAVTPTSHQVETVLHDEAICAINSAIAPDPAVGSKIPYKKPEIISKSKVDRMFGDDWRKKASVASDAPKHDTHEDGYKGFLLIECPACGKLKAFCTKTPIKSSFCHCGYEIMLDDLKLAYMNCKCGKRWKYRTNFEDRSFTHECLSCKSPIDVVYNIKKNVYQSME